MREGIAIYEFQDAWEARLAKDALDDAGFDAWLESDPPAFEGDVPRRFRLVVPVEDADEARSALTEPLLELPDTDIYDDAPPRRQWWVPIVAALVLVGMVVAAVPRFLWPWILLTAFVGFLVWRAVGPRRP